MAFDKSELVRVDSNLGANRNTYCGNCAIWNYILTAAEDITSAGYIPTTAGVKGGDKVIKIVLTVASTGNVTARSDTEYYAKTGTDGTITLAAF